MSSATTVDQGGGSVGGWTLGVLAFACAWWIVVLGVLHAGVPAPLDDGWEYGVVAHHLAHGQGFRTTVIHPPVWPLHDELFTVPVLVHGPLLSVLLLPFVVASKAIAVEALAWVAALFAALAAFVLFRFARRTAGPHVAAAAALLFTISPLTLQAVAHDASFVVGSFWLILAIERLSAARSLAAGLAIGAGALTRPELALAALLLVVLVRERRGLMLFGFLVPFVPWAWHQTVSSGLPFFNLSSYLLLAFTRDHPELSVLRSFDLTIDRWPSVVMSSLPSLPAKWLYALPRALKHLLTAPTWTTGWLAPVGLLTAWRGSLAGALPLGAAYPTLFAIPFAMMVVAQHRADFIVPFLPLWAIAAALGARATLDRMRMPHAPVLVLAVLLGAPNAGIGVAHAVVAAWSNQTWLTRERVALSQRFGRDHTAVGKAPPRVVFSDTPDFVAWTTGLPTVWTTRAELDSLYRDAARGRTALPRDFPPRREDAATWFHRDL